MEKLTAELLSDRALMAVKEECLMASFLNRKGVVFIKNGREILDQVHPQPWKLETSLVEDTLYLLWQKLSKMGYNVSKMGDRVSVTW